MATDKKISALDAATSLSSGELFAIVQSFASKSVTWALMKQAMMTQDLPPLEIVDDSLAYFYADASSSFKLLLGGNRTLTEAVSPAEGMFRRFIITQGSGGSHTLTWPVTFKWPGGTPPTLSTAAGAIDIIEAYYDGTSWLAKASLGYA